jgi:hypothetical protein
MSGADSRTLTSEHRSVKWKHGSVTWLWAEFGGESVLVAVVAGLALVEAAPGGPVLDVADGAQLGVIQDRSGGDDQAAERVADPGGDQRGSVTIPARAR